MSSINVKKGKYVLGAWLAIAELIQNTYNKKSFNANTK